MHESFFGPPSQGKRGRGAQAKKTVILTVSTWKDESGHEKPGFAHAFVVEDASADAIKNVLQRISLPENEIEPLITRIRTDGWRSYKVASKELGIRHHRAIC